MPSPVENVTAAKMMTEVMSLPVLANVPVFVDASDGCSRFVPDAGSEVGSNVGFGADAGAGLNGCSIEPVNIMKPGALSSNVRLTLVMPLRSALFHVAIPVAGSYVPLEGVMVLGAMNDPSTRFAVLTVTGKSSVAGRVAFWFLAFISSTCMRVWSGLTSLIWLPLMSRWVR